MRSSSRLPAVLLVVGVLSLFYLPWGAVEGFSAGAPEVACVEMVPNHGHKPRTTPPPYQLTPGGAVVNSGSKISVTISTISPTGHFKGFLIQARDTTTQEPLGSFLTKSFKLNSCGNGSNNAVTHRNSNPKVTVVVAWVAPENFEGEVAFRATVVQMYEKIFVGLTSEKVTVLNVTDFVPVIPVIGIMDDSSDTLSKAPEDSAGAESSPTTLPTTPRPAPTTTRRSGGASTRRRGLLGNFRARNTEAPRTTPEATTPARVRESSDSGNRGSSASSGSSAIDNIYLGCNVNKGCFGMPIGCEGNCDAMMTYTKIDTGYLFEIMGKANMDSDSSFVAAGLSSDDRMGDDSVMACRSQNGIVDITMSVNVGKTNQFLTDQKLGLSDYEMTQVDGIIYCRFTRADSVEIQNMVFDLDNDTYYLMVSKGPLAGDGSLSYHSGGRVVSDRTTALSQFKALGGANNLFVLLHASFMVSAWVGAASSGILLARYFKQTWRNYKACNIDQWFHFHRLFMVLTWGLTIAAFVLMALQVDGWPSTPASESPHPYIGIVSVGLCFIQPFMAMLRCAPTSPKRNIFNWFHWFVGNAAQILAITAIFFGLDMLQLPHWTWWIMIFFVGFHILVHIMLSIGQVVSDSKAKNQVTGIPLKDMNGSRDMLQPPQHKLLDAPGATFRKALLGVYLLVVWLVVALILLVINVGEDQLKMWGVIFWE